MVAFNDFLLLLDGYLSGSWWFPALLIGTGIFFTFYLGFPQFRFFSHGWRIVTGKYVKEETEGETSPFEALTTAMSGAVGTGNIGGVALAIWVGGPAAIFWMWVTAIFGMTTKFVEVSLSHAYREKNKSGEISGGPMIYMEKGLNMKWLGTIFAFCLLISTFGRVMIIPIIIMTCSYCVTILKLNFISHFLQFICKVRLKVGSMLDYLCGCQHV